MGSYNQYIEKQFILSYDLLETYYKDYKDYKEYNAKLKLKGFQTNNAYTKEAEQKLIKGYIEIYEEFYKTNMYTYQSAKLRPLFEKCKKLISRAKVDIPEKYLTIRPYLTRAEIACAKKKCLAFRKRIKEQIASSKGKATPTKSQSFARKELIAEVEKFLSTDAGQYVGCVSITTFATPLGYRLESHLKEFIAMY